MLMPLTNDDQSRLQRLNQQKEVVFALKKLYLNTATKGKLPSEVGTLAAERIALDIGQEFFKELSIIQPIPQTEVDRENLV